MKYPVLYRLREFVEVPKVQIFALYEKKALSERSEFADDFDVLNSQVIF